MKTENKYGSMGVWEYGGSLLILRHILSGTRIPKRRMED